MNLLPTIWLFRYLFGCCLLVIGLNVTPIAIAGDASIVTDKDIIGDGVSLQALKDIACANAVALGVTPTPPTCLLGPGERFVFVTSSTSDGNLGGLADADANCNALASAAGLPGKYKAWLSKSTVDARDRVGNHKWKRPDGVVVADDLADLTNGDLDFAINLDENGAAPSANLVWTGTATDGTEFLFAGTLPRSCVDWVSTAPGFQGLVGNAIFASSNWTEVGFADCDGGTPVSSSYCFGN